MEITAYTLPGCNNCNYLRELFTRSNKEYTEVVVKVDISVEYFKQKYPSINGFPFVVIDDTPIGGLVETVKLFVEKGLVSSSQKKE